MSLSNNQPTIIPASSIAAPIKQKTTKKQQNNKKNKPSSEKCPKMNSTTLDSHAPPRPYTEYNIFFQIEREYILQNLGVVPKLKSEDIFSITDKNYEGPTLPPKYDGLVLSYDWYIPGKGRRKKRQHIASHGKISFTDLSKSVAAAWRQRDEETKTFTKTLADVGMAKYKVELKKYQDLISAGLIPAPTMAPTPAKETKKSSKKKAASTKKSKKVGSSTSAAAEAQGSASMMTVITAPSSPVASPSASAAASARVSGNVTPTLDLNASWVNTIHQHPTGSPISSNYELRRQVSNDCLTSYNAQFDSNYVISEMPPLDPVPEDQLMNSISGNNSDCSFVDLGDDDILNMYMSFVNSD